MPHRASIRRCWTVIRETFLQRASRRLGDEVGNVAMLGAGVLSYHARRLAGQKECVVRIGGVGDVLVRPTESDLATLRGTFHVGEYWPAAEAARTAILQSYREIVERGEVPVIVDAGANIGAATLWLRRKFPDAHIVAIEPDPASSRMLERNTAGLERVTAVEAAVGAEPGHVRLFTEGDSWATQTERAEDGTQIITMDEAFALVPEGRPFLAKIDIEGFESDLFSSNLDWLDAVTAVFLEPHDWRFPGQRTSRSFQKAMGERDFELFVTCDNLLYIRTPPSGAE